MMNKMPFALCAMSVLLAACGGGGSGSPSTQPTNTNTAPATNNPAQSANTNPTSGYATFQIPDMESDLSSAGVMTASNYKLHLNGKTYANKGVVDISSLNKGLNTQSYTAEITLTPAGGQSYQEKYDGDLRLYKQDYSVVLGTYTKNQYRSNNNNTAELIDEFTVDDIQGNITPFASLPSSGRYTYNGEAFTHQEAGKLSYTVDFDKRRGSGMITGLNETGDITLNAAPISRIDEAPFKGGSQIDGEGLATSSKLGRGSYGLGFFGPKAEEIAGYAEFTRETVNFGESDVEVGFGGRR